MTESDHKVFPCDIKNVLWSDFNETYALGVRVFYAKDPLNTLPQATRRLFWMKILHYTVRTIYLSAVFTLDYYILKFFGVIDFVEKFYSDNVIGYFTN